jgi:hypothetical protein
LLGDLATKRRSFDWPRKSKKRDHGPGGGHRFTSGCEFRMVS